MTTTFHSTRSTTDSLTAKQAIRKGLADDGGLFVSDALGKTKVDVAALRDLETADVRFKDVVAIDGMEDYVEKAAQAL